MHFAPLALCTGQQNYQEKFTTESKSEYTIFCFTLHEVKMVDVQPFCIHVMSDQNGGLKGHMSGSESTNNLDRGKCIGEEGPYI